MVALHDGLHYNTFQYCFVNIFFTAHPVDVYLLKESVL
jgi:hypothetical protein